MNFTVFTNNVALQDIPSYSTSITLECQVLNLYFLWNERIGKRILSVKNSTGVVYLQNTILHPNETFELNSYAILDDIPYSVTLIKVGDVTKTGNIFNWSKDFILCFSKVVDLESKVLNVTYGVSTPIVTEVEPPIEPPVEEGISCDNANSVILFQPFNVFGQSTEIEFDGELVGGTLGSIADFINTGSQLSGIIIADSDGYLNIRNLDTVSNHRMKLTFVGDVDFLPTVDSIVVSENLYNPAHYIEVVDSDKVRSIEFCLAKA